MFTKERIEKRRARMLLKRPFVGAIAMRLELVEDLTHPTAYVAPKLMGYNPHFVDILTDDELDMLIMHEVFHLVLKHSFRRGDRDRLRRSICPLSRRRVRRCEMGHTTPCENAAKSSLPIPIFSLFIFMLSYLDKSSGKRLKMTAKAFSLANNI